jgi:hypothetical protein
VDIHVSDQQSKPWVRTGTHFFPGYNDDTSFLEVYTYDDDGDILQETYVTVHKDDRGHVTTNEKITKKADGQPDDITETEFRDGNVVSGPTHSSGPVHHK